MSRRSVRTVIRRSVFVLAALISWSTRAGAQTWTPLTTLAPSGTGTMLQLTDGRVIVQSCGTCGNWLILRPNSTGSYVGGTWSSAAPMSIPRLYFASHILPSGQLWVLGGEYSGNTLTANWTNTGEIYDPIANSWSPIAHHPESQFGDDPSMLLEHGQILAGSLGTRNTYIYDIASNTWGAAIPKYYVDRSDEETWVKLQDGRVLTYDLFKSIATGGEYAEKFDPVSQTWIGVSPSDGTAAGAIPPLSSAALGFELGPTVRLHDGRVLLLGATNHTALYTPSTNSWAAGPDMSIGTAHYGADDAPAAVLPSGHVLFVADRGPDLGTFSPPSQFFDFDPSSDTITPVAFPGSLNHPAYVTRLVVLPTGQVLYGDGSRQMWVYTPPSGIDAKVRPVVNAVTYDGMGIFTLTGKQLNGQSSGSSYGDDVESDQNYPIIRLQNASGVFYARTTNWTTNGVATGVTPESVTFTLPAGLLPGNYALIVSGSGVSGIPLFINITAAQIAGS
jgi:hypothetical protein